MESPKQKLRKGLIEQKVSSFHRPAKKRTAVHELLHDSMLRRGEAIVDMVLRWGELSKKDRTLLSSMEKFTASRRGSKTSDLTKAERDFWTTVLYLPSDTPLVQVARTALELFETTMMQMQKISNLRADLRDLKKFLEEDCLDCPAWVYLYHVERISRAINKPINYPMSQIKTRSQAQAVLREATKYI